jgi:HD-like signal output (HDOD) protein
MTQPLIAIIQHHLEKDETQLPPFDGTAQRIQQEITKEDPDVQLIEKLIVRDQALTGQVLRLANSSFFQGLVKVSTVRNAIVRLGINEVSNIVTLITHERNYCSKDPRVNAVMRKLWRHSVGCAVGAHWLAKHSGFRSLVHEAFFAGLLHDVGKLFILTVVENVKRSGEIATDPSDALLEEVMSSLHCRYGQGLMAKWNLPERYCKVAGAHHEETFDPKDFLTLLVRVANQACNKLGIGLEGDDAVILSALPEAKLLGLGDIDLAQLEVWLEDAKLT